MDAGPAVAIVAGLGMIWALMMGAFVAAFVILSHEGEGH